MSYKEFGLESERVMVAANFLLKMAGCRQRLTACIGSLERGYKYRSATGKTIVVPVGRQHGAFTMIRSILQRIDEKRPCNWLINGQADTNMKTLYNPIYSAPVIHYDRGDAIAMDCELLMATGISPASVESSATDRINRMQADPRTPTLADQTQLVVRDEHDEPTSFLLAAIVPPKQIHAA
ncbi:hypothetical protein [Marinobacter shengliensis]|uniref:hypothetical protein n=1 Tax=Marinobacter shengliensis TaxID=1389223 RepID=UPI0011084947|nr:hypothetical protein [Marinobacter shengliensis]